MRKAIFLLLVSFLAVSATGCVTAKKVVRERVDQNLSGNQGYLQGTPSEPTTQRAKDREYIDVKIELPMWNELNTKGPKQKAKIERTKDTSLGGNRGYLMSGEGFEEELPPISGRRRSQAYEEDVEYEDVGAGEVGMIEEEIFIPSYQEYKVKKGDTLSHISKDFYGKASKWTIIYEANSDKIKDPSKLKPGIVLIIPDLEEAESRYIK